ncbi:MAG TPA: rhomboid family intramembrane serine protease [Flavitalea sp.]|nr:rhomboid family intramembrane serine protease [Flavitalea sp.]
MLRITPIVRNLIFVNVVVFVLQNMSPVITEWLALWNVQTPNFKPYQLFTYMFCHADFFHIFFNMLLLSFFGPILEEFWDQKQFLLFYIITGIGAGVFNILMDLFFGLGSFSIMIGASGAVYGVMTAFGIIFPNMELRLLLLPISFKAKYMVMVLGSIAIYSGFRSSSGDNTAHLAHLGGIVVAIILIQFWMRRR